MDAKNWIRTAPAAPGNRPCGSYRYITQLDDPAAGAHRRPRSLNLAYRSRSRPRRIACWPIQCRSARRRPAARSGPRIAALDAVGLRARVLTQQQVLERLGLEGDEFAEGIFARCGVKRRHLNLERGLPRDARCRAAPRRSSSDLLRHAIRAVDALGVDPANDRHRAHREPLLARLFRRSPTACSTTTGWTRRPTSTTSPVSAARAAIPLMRLTSQALREHPEQPGPGRRRGEHEQHPDARHAGGPAGEDRRLGALRRRLRRRAALERPARRRARSSSPRRSTRSPTRSTPSASTSTGDDSYLHLARELPGPRRRRACRSWSTRLPAPQPARALGRSTTGSSTPAAGASSRTCSARSSSRDDDVAVSWDALAEHGNVGTPSIFYVLKDTIERRDPRPGEHGLMVTIGPGVTVGLMLLCW